MSIESALQRAFRFVPAALREQHIGMDRPTRPVERRRIAVARELVDELAPFRGTLPVACVRAGGDEVAVRLGERVDVPNPAGRGRGHRLLEQPHALLPPSCADLGAPQQADREHLEVSGSGVPRDRQGSAGVLDPFLEVLGMSGALDRNPALAGARAGAFDDALRARQPTPRGGRTAADQMLMRYPDREPSSVVTAAVARVPLDCLLPGGDGVPDATQKPQSETEAVARVGRFLVGERGLEGGPGLLPVRRLERLPALVESVAERHVHRRRSVRGSRGDRLQKEGGDVAGSFRTSACSVQGRCLVCLRPRCQGAVAAGTRFPPLPACRRSRPPKLRPTPFGQRTSGRSGGPRCRARQSRRPRLSRLDTRPPAPRPRASGLRQLPPDRPPPRCRQTPNTAAIAFKWAVKDSNLRPWD